MVTTIGPGSFLDSYVKNLNIWGTADRVHIIVIPDLKTPATLFNKCHELRRNGVNVNCPTVEEQDSYLAKLGLSNLVTYNSDHRRNVGFLMALDSEADYVISIDDDNLCRDQENFIEEHAVVCDGAAEFDVAKSSDGWFNICGLMDVEPANVYPRGFPFASRGKSARTEQRRDQATVHLNAGLWLQDPDLDAATWLVNPAKAISFRGNSVVLDKDTWSPVNTQNTAVFRDAIVAFYFVRMGFVLAGMRMDRWGDIFSGYFCQACVRHLGYRIRIGTPLVNHIRNRHNYLKDLSSELPCMWLMEEMIESVRELRLQGGTYVDAYLSLAQGIHDCTEKVKSFNEDHGARDFLHTTAEHMRLWTKAIKAIAG